MTPMPNRRLVSFLGLIASRDAANAAIGDALEELAERTVAGRTPRHPALWLNLQVARAIGMEFLAAAPRMRRSSGVILRDAFRAVRAAPAHSLFLVFVLAAGITLATLTFSVVDAVMLRPLPVDHPERLVTISTMSTLDQHHEQRITPDVFWRLHDRLHSVEELAARSTLHGAMITIDHVRREGAMTQATADIFPLLRLSTAIGRWWTADEEARGEANVAVLGYRFWHDALGADPSILGKTVSVAGSTRTYTVIGVLSAATDHPEVDLTTSQVWVPMAVPHAPMGHDWFGLIARLRPGVSSTQLGDEVERITAAPGWRPDVTPLLDTYVASVRRWMLLALGAAALVVLVACANAANLMLTRSVARAQELAVRASLGASRRQIAIGVLVEGLVLSAGATAGALFLSVPGLRVAKVAVMSALPGMFRASTIAINGRVLTAAIACAAVTGVLCSLVPAWQTSEISLSTLLKDTGSTSTSRRRWRSVFLIAEVAAVVVLLSVSWLFVTSLIRTDSIDLGIDCRNLLAVSPRLAFRTNVDDVQQRIARVPGVSAVAVSTGASLPLVGRAFGGAWKTTTVQRVGDISRNASVEVLHYNVTRNYFAVAGLRFRQGGTWQSDSADAMSALVLDEQAAWRLFGRENAVGQQVRAVDPGGVHPIGIFTVIGVVPHVYARGPEETDPPSAYFPLAAKPDRKFASLFVKTSGPPEEVMPAVNEALKPAAPDLTEPFVFVAGDAVSRITAMRRFNAELLALFGLVAMLIGAAGVYAVMMSFVAQQTHEIGVRVALGATPARIQSGVLALASRHLLAGLALGVPIAWWLSRGFAALLFQVTPADPSVYAGVAGLLSAIALLSAWVPARRAATIDPIVSLRR